MSTSAPIRTGIVGFGRVAEGHLKCLHEHEDRFAVEAVCDLTPARREAATAAGIPQAYEDLEEFLASGVELVYITTHSSTHYQLAKPCLKAGRHIVIEKPITLDADEVAELFSLARERDLVAYPWHNRRFDKDYQAVRRIIAEHDIGDFLRVENRTAGNRPAVGFGVADFNQQWRITADLGGGTLWDFGPHWVDQVLDLVPGTVVGVLGQVRHVRWGDAEDFFHITLLFDHGAHVVAGKVDVAFHSFPKWLIYGSEATVWSEAGMGSAAHWRRDDEEHVLHDPGPAPDMTANVADVIRGEASPLITMDQALRTARVLDAARASAAVGKQIDVEI